MNHEPITASNHFILFTAIALLLFAQACKTDRQDLFIVDTVEEYRAQVAENPDMKLVDIEKHIDNIFLDIRYATEDNFTGELIYTEPMAFLRRPVADALKKVQDSLSLYDLGLMVYDAYRPYAATVKFYEVYPDPDFVADPQFGSRHNRGCAVDVTLIELATGIEIPMPTDYDEFTERAHPEYMDFPEEVIANRSFLFDLMAHYGFTHYPTEWWHFDYEGWENYPLMDLSFEELSENK
jgi:zinc D-Ala-D-Ala dipeptidase